MMLRKNQQGGVSIFIVLFTALLITVVTTSFVQTMVRNERQASNNDLSQSAYDSAMAGVEDAKRALVRLAECGNSGGGPTCTTIRGAFANSDTCTFLGTAGVATFNEGEVQVGHDSLNQAYTCVKVRPNPETVTGVLVAGDAGKLIHLDGSGFDTVRLSWFTQANLEDAAGDPDAVLADWPHEDALVGSLLPQDWSPNFPPILRAQVIQFSRSGTSLSDFNRGTGSNARTAFLYPEKDDDERDPTDMSLSGRDLRTGNGNALSPTPVKCGALKESDGGYYCSADLRLPSLSNREVYLQLASIYGGTSYAIELLDGSTPVSFGKGHAEVDSTGRASALFRRVKANISITAQEAAGGYPDAALSIEGNLCKNFSVSSDRDDYEANCNARTDE